MPLKEPLIKLFDRYGIEYGVIGKNIAKGNIGINCPFCGDDTSYHLGINTTNGKWGCWRNPRHAGRHIAALISYLLGITYRQAQKELNLKVAPSDVTIEDEILALLADNIKIVEKTKNQDSLIELDTLRKINKSSTKIFHDYLLGRFDNDESAVYDIINFYRLRCSLIGYFAWRVVFPITMDGNIVNYTGRTIYKGVKPRYKWMDNKDAIIPAKSTIFNWDDVKDGGNRLFICEGPIDAIKMEYASEDDKATCLYNMTLAPMQFQLLYQVAPKYNRLYIVFDRGTLAEAMVAYDQLSITRKVDIAQIPEQYKDPGEMKFSAIKKFIHLLK